MKTIGILVFEQVEELDFIGPLEVFGMASQFGADCQTVLIAPQLLGPLRCRHGLRVLPECTRRSTCSRCTYHSRRYRRTNTGKGRSKILEFVRQQRGLVASVGTGALILAAAGVLDDLAATTHHSALDLLREHAAVKRSQPGETRTEAGGMEQGFGIGQTGAPEGWSGLRLCNLVAQSSRAAQRAVPA